MNQELALRKLAEVIPGSVDIATRKLHFSPQQALDVFGKPPLECNDIVAILPLFSEEEREEIEEGIYKKQQAFWDDPAQVKYYIETHPQLPFVSEHFDQFVKAISPEDTEVVVDLGCGCGALMKRLLARNEGVRIIGIDYAPNVLDMVPRLVPNLGDGRIELINHDLRRGIPLPDGSQKKMASNWGVVNFLPDDLERSFAEVRRVLESGGRFVCSALVEGERMRSGDFLKRTPNKLSLLWEAMNKLRKGIIQAGWKFEKNLRLLFPVYSPEELTRMMERAGLSIVKKEYTLMGKSITIVAQKGNSKEAG